MHRPLPSQARMPAVQVPAGNPLPSAAGTGMHFIRMRRTRRAIVLNAASDGKKTCSGPTA